MTDQSTSPVEGVSASSSEVDDGSSVIETNDDFASFEKSIDEQPEGQDVPDDPDELEDETEGDDGDEPESVLEEIEYEGKNYKLPKELKDAVLRQSDYTKKTQAVAEERKQLEQRAQQFHEQVRIQEAQVVEVGKLVSINEQVAQLEQVNWEQFARERPADAQAEFMRFQRLKDQRAGLVGSIQQRVQEQKATSEREFKSSLEAGRAELQSKIPGYSPELESKLADFGTEHGFSRDEILDAVSDPRSIEVLHLAYLGKQALAQQKKTQTIAQGQRTAPAKTLRGKSGQFKTAPNTNDFSAFEKLADRVL